MTAHDSQHDGAAIEPVLEPAAKPDTSASAETALDSAAAWLQPPEPAAQQAVPMLTEVIDNPAGPPDEQGPPTRPLSDEPDEPPAAAPSGQPLDVADSLTQALAPMLEARISEAIARVLHEQLLGLNARVQREVAVVVRQAVAEALERQQP